MILQIEQREQVRHTKSRPGSRQITEDDRRWAEEEARKDRKMETGYFDLLLVDRRGNVLDHTIEIK